MNSQLEVHFKCNFNNFRFFWMKTQTCKTNAENYPFWQSSCLCQDIYKASKIVITRLKCGKNMDLLTIEILTITCGDCLESCLKCNIILSGIADENEFLNSMNIWGESFSGKNHDFWIWCKKYIASMLMWFHNWICNLRMA